MPIKHLPSDVSLDYVKKYHRSPRHRPSTRFARSSIALLLIGLATFALYYAWKDTYSGLNTAVRRITGQEADFNGDDIESDIDNKELALLIETIRVSRVTDFARGEKSDDGEPHDPIDVCPIILALNVTYESPTDNAELMAMSLGSLLNLRHVIKHPPIVVWKRGTTFDVIPKGGKLDKALREAATNGAFIPFVIEGDPLKLNNSYIFADTKNLPATRNTLKIRSAAKQTEYYIAGLRLCLHLKCSLCTIMEEGLKISSVWPQRMRDAIRTGGWDAVVTYKDVDNAANLIEGWAMEDVPALIVLVLFLSLLLYVVLALIASPDEQTFNQIYGNAMSVWTKCLVFSLVCIALMGRSFFLQCTKSVLEMELQRDDIGFFYRPRYLFSGVTTLKTDPVIREMIGPMTEAFQHSLGHKDITAISLEARVIVPTPDNPDREFVKFDARTMAREFLQVIRKSRILLTAS